VERREALGPTSLGPRAPQAAASGNGDPAVGARRTPVSGPSKGASQAPWRLPALHSPFGEGKGTTARPAPQTNRAAKRWLTVVTPT